MTPRFMAIGECMVELAPSGEGQFAMGFAGDTFNTAWYLSQVAKDALRVSYMSAIGDDAVSAQMRNFVANAGVEPELTVIPGTSVGLYMISLKNGERSFSYWRSASAAKRLAEDLKAVAGLVEGDVAFFSGITLAILDEAGRANLLSALAQARTRGVTVAFDPNLRPRLWESTGDMCRWITLGADVSDMALPSFEDEQDFFQDADKAATVQRYRSSGVKTVIVKDGPGEVLIDAPGFTGTYVPQIIDTPVDTTAAGDSFNAGFMNAFMTGKDLQTAVAEGSALSAKVICARGALVQI